MKDRHINIAEDSLLMKKLHREVEANLVINHRKTAVLLIVKFAVYLGITALCYSLLYTTGSIYFFFLCFILYGLSSVLFGFNFAHDFSHNTVFRNKRLNNLCFSILYTLVGAHAEAWKHRHIHSHHYAPNVKDYDSDLQITSLIRVEPDSAYKWFHRFQHYYAPVAYMTYSFYWVFIKDFVIYFSPVHLSQQKNAGYHFSFWLQKLFYISYILVLPLLFSGFEWYWVLVAFAVMHMVQSLFLLLTFFMTHHVETTEYFQANEEGYIPASWFLNQVKSSNDFYPFSKTANFIFGGFNNHVAHHLFPHIHHVHYPQLNVILYRILRENGIDPNVTGFFSGIISHLRHLKNLSVKSKPSAFPVNA